LARGILPKEIEVKGQVSGKVGNSLAQNISTTSISTAGAGTWTAEAIASGLIVRTGPSEGYTDTTATAAQLVAAFPGAKVGDTFEFTVVNGVAQACTVTGGSGVTGAGTVNISASKIKRYLGIFTNVSAGTEAVTLRSLGELGA
jgi:hypothetical protein